MTKHSKSKIYSITYLPIHAFVWIQGIDYFITIF